METVKQPSQKVLQRRKFLMVLPLIAIPFLTMAFWALGGGKGEMPQGQVLQRTEGFNMELPTANVDNDSNWNKMKFYEQADKQAAERETQIRNDPYYNLPLTPTEEADTFGVLTPVNTRGKRLLNEPSILKSPYASTEYKDPQEAKVYKKLAELDKELRVKTEVPRLPATSSYQERSSPRLATSTTGEDESPEIRRLQAMMQDMQTTAAEPDPEMQEINQVLEKLMDVQHPERVREKLKEQSAQQKGKVFAVSASSNELPVSLLDQSSATKTVKDSMHLVKAMANGFYSLDEPVSEDVGGNAITAVIHEEQTLVAGATVKLRLTNSVFIQGVLIPKDQFVYGTAALNGERLLVTINSIRYRNGLYPVELSVYDLDGMAGINIPGAITRDVAKQSADQSLQGLGLSSLDPSIGMQAASAGIEVTKNLLSKRVKLIKVTVKAGYQVLLKDNNNK